MAGTGFLQNSRLAKARHGIQANRPGGLGPNVIFVINPLSLSKALAFLNHAPFFPAWRQIPRWREEFSVAKCRKQGLIGTVPGPIEG
jgi:hypothetical protein